MASKETQEQKEAYKYYASMKDGRSYARVSLKFNKSLVTIENWGKKFKWQERIQELEKQNIQKANEHAAAEKEVDYIQRNLQITKLGILKFAKNIKDGNIKIGVKEGLALMDMERKLRTGVDANIQITHQLAIKNMTNEELAEKLTKMADNIKDLPTMKKYEELKKDRIIDAVYKEVPSESKESKESKES